METAVLTKPEEAQIDRMAEGFAEPSMEDRFKDWASRSLLHSKNEKKAEEGKYRRREISLENRPDDERKFIEAVAERDETENQSREAEKDSSGRTEQRTDGEKPAAGKSDFSQPLSGDNHWKAKWTQPELDNHWRHVDARAGVALQYINSRPQQEQAQISAGLKSFFAGKPAEWQHAVEADLYTALAEVPNPGEVLRHIALKGEDREVIRSAKNWQQLREYIHTIAKHYGAKSQTASKPRAPKLPSEVSARGEAGDGNTRGETDFASFDRKQRARYARAR